MRDRRGQAGQEDDLRLDGRLHRAALTAGVVDGRGWSSPVDGFVCTDGTAGSEELLEAERLCVNKDDPEADGGEDADDGEDADWRRKRGSHVTTYRQIPEMVYASFEAFSTRFPPSRTARSPARRAESA